jgi:simple sugar transport system ATP-binding protein
MADKLLEVKNISKFYAGVRALDDVSMTLERGEIHCLVGENGSGKSTLIKAIAGVIPIDKGEIIINGHTYKHLHAIDSIREGVQVIYQDLSLFPHLTVAENISLNQLVEEGRKILHWKEVQEIAQKELAKIGIQINADELVEDLSMANKQIVAIVRALTQDAKLIIMDEPTTALTKSEIDSLFSIILDLQANGLSILFVSHKLSEVLEISEKVAVLRDGKKVGEFNTKELDTDTLVFHMTGKKLDRSTFKYEAQKQQKPLLELRNLSKKGDYEDIHFTLQPGEILGITGLLGAGRTELALSIFGLNTPDSGEIYVDGKLVIIGSPQDAVALGIGLLPEDRHLQGLFLHQTIGDNIVATILKRLLTRFKLFSNRQKTQAITQWVEKLKIRTPSLETAAENLSGGNQQRVVLAKWLATNPKIFILDSPTIGIDIASKSEIHNMIRDLARQGIGIIMISDEIPEVLHNCNRVLVMKEGRIIDEVDTNKTTEDELFEIVSGKH